MQLNLADLIDEIDFDRLIQGQRCSFCQNWYISQWPKENLPKHIDTGVAGISGPICPQLAALEREIAGERVTPSQIVDAILASGCLSLSYTFTEPTIFYELAYDTAVSAKNKGLM